MPGHVPGQGSACGGPFSKRAWEHRNVMPNYGEQFRSDLSLTGISSSRSWVRSMASCTVPEETLLGAPCNIFTKPQASWAVEG